MGCIKREKKRREGRSVQERIKGCRREKEEVYRREKVGM
jgi:hypothetical protein